MVRERGPYKTLDCGGYDAAFLLATCRAGDSPACLVGTSAWSSGVCFRQANGLPYRYGVGGRSEVSSVPASAPDRSWS